MGASSLQKHMTLPSRQVLCVEARAFGPVVDAFLDGERFTVCFEQLWHFSDSPAPAQITLDGHLVIGFSDFLELRSIEY